MAVRIGAGVGRGRAEDGLTGGKRGEMKKLVLQVASVETEVDPIQVCPSPRPVGSQEVFE